MFSLGVRMFPVGGLLCGAYAVPMRLLDADWWYRLAIEPS
jgi:hypothetical protein